jgi:hypothetical protein
VVCVCVCVCVCVKKPHRGGDGTHPSGWSHPLSHWFAYVQINLVHTFQGGQWLISQRSPDQKLSSKMHISVYHLQKLVGTLGAPRTVRRSH